MNVAANKTVVLIGCGIAIAGIWGGVAYAHHRRQERDRKATAFFMELQRELAPDSIGLVESEAFDIQYWQNIQKKIKKKVALLKGSEAMGYADDIRAGWHWYSNDKSKIYSVFRALKDQVAVSQVAYFYYINIKDPKNKINLIEDLKSNMNSDDVKTILGIVNKLPKYRTA